MAGTWWGGGIQPVCENIFLVGIAFEFKRAIKDSGLNLLEGLLTLRLLGISSRVFESIDLGQCPRIQISNKFTGDTDAAGLEITPRMTGLHE